MAMHKTTMWELATMIQNQDGIPPDIIRLIYNKVVIFDGEAHEDELLQARSGAHSTVEQVSLHYASSLGCDLLC